MSAGAARRFMILSCLGAPPFQSSGEKAKHWSCPHGSPLWSMSPPTSILPAVVIGIIIWLVIAALSVIAWQRRREQLAKDEA